MTKTDTQSTASAPSAKTDPVGKPDPKTHTQDAPPTANDLGKGIDRPGFDLGGSSGETHAGSGLGLGEDAFEAPGDRRLPGRRLDNKLTIPRWSGPEPRDPTPSDKNTAGTEPPSPPKTKKSR